MISKKEGSQKIKCTVGILTFNSEKTLLKCLKSVSDFSEIVICDGGSSDDTIEIVKKFDCVVLRQDERYKHTNNKIADFSGVRNQLLEKSSQEWFMFIDSDEFLSEELVDEMREIVASADGVKKGAYKMPRKFILDGSIIDCASSYPNYQMRFFKKDHVNFFTKKVHERIQIKENTNVGTLLNHVMVPIESDSEVVRSKHAYYLSIEYQRSFNQPYSALFTAVRFNTKALLIRIFKYLTTVVMCRGTRMPLKRELLNMRYSLSLMSILSKFLLHKFFSDLRELCVGRSR